MSETPPHGDGPWRAEPGRAGTPPDAWEPGPASTTGGFLPGPGDAPAPDGVPGPGVVRPPEPAAAPLAARRDDDLPLIVKHPTEHNGLARNSILCLVVAGIGVSMLWALPVDPFTGIATLAMATIGCRYSLRSHNAVVRGDANNRVLGLAGGVLNAAAFVGALVPLARLL